MKALVLQSSDGEYDDYHEIVDSVLLVPDDFEEKDLRELREEWKNDDSARETKTARWANKHGSGTRVVSTQKVSFYRWLRTRFETIKWTTVSDEVMDCDGFVDTIDDVC